MLRFIKYKWSETYLKEVKDSNVQKKICSLHDSIIGLCSRQEELLAANKTHTKNFKMNLKKIVSITKEAKKAGQAMENRRTMSRELFKLYAVEMGFEVKRRTKK